MGPSLFLPVPEGLPAGGSSAAKLAPAEKDVLLAMALLHQRLGTNPALQQPAANGYRKPCPPGRVEWQGEALHGRTIVLLGEDGHGDQI